MAQAKPETAAKDKPAPTFVTVRFVDGTGPKGTVFKRVHNLFFAGGKDANGLPILSNSKDKELAFVSEKSGMLRIFKTDGEGRIAVNADGKPAKEAVSVNLKKFVDGFEAGLAASGLAAGQGTITGPGAKKLAGMLSEAMNKAAAERAARAEAKASEGKPARKASPKP